MKKETMGVAVASGRSYPTCSRQITMPAPHQSIMYRPDALPDAQPTVSRCRLFRTKDTVQRNVTCTYVTLQYKQRYELSRSLLWPPCTADADIIFCYCGYFLLGFPRLISAVGDWMSTILPHMMWP